MIKLLALVLVLTTTVGAQPASPQRAGDWPVSTPEAQGLDSNKLADAIEFCLREGLNIHSLLVIRNGHIVADAVFYPYAPDTRHDVASVTKSVTSTLIGIAIDKGLIKDVREPVLGLFPGRQPDNLDDRKKAITLEHLLLMESGLACVSSPTEETLFRMIAAPDWVQYMLDLPMSDPPGTRFVYNSGAVHLLSAIIRERAGMSAYAFARQHLFGPLGITDVVWPLDPKFKDNHGWGDLQLRPHDMAKIGALILNKGVWDGRRILSERWVEEATSRHLDLDRGEGYGYLWWMTAPPVGLVEARGRGGQRIIIWRDKNIVLVFTGGGYEPGRLGPFLLGAVKSDKALPHDPAGQARLGAAIKRAAEPRAAPAVATAGAPETAGLISGKRFVLEPNGRGIGDLVLTFSDAREAELILGLGSGASGRSKLAYRLGLDGRPRLAPGRYGLPAACRGSWTGPRTFLIEINELGNINRFRVELTFQGGRVTGTFAELTGLGSVPIEGEIK